MLEQILNYIHNFFIKEVHRGKFAIVDGELQVDFLLENQYCKIVGSVFNDKVHKYLSGGLTDEVFEGEVWAMAVPPTLIALIPDIEAWVSKYGDAVNSPYQSESFGGYSYSKATGVGKDGTAKSSYDWRDVFSSSLNQWRKLS